MDTSIRIQLMNTFAIYIDTQEANQLLAKSRKGVALMQYLILNGGQSVPNYRILGTLWADDHSANPENALKTLVSRLRIILNQIYPGMGACIVADRGAYHWKSLPNMTVDVYEIEELFDHLGAPGTTPFQQRAWYADLLRLYTGDLLYANEQCDWALARGTLLHNKYMSAVYAYVEMLKADENYEEVATVCRSALDVDQFDDRLHMELMTALIKTNRTSDALIQYKHVMHLNYRYLGIQPSDDMQEFYKQIVHAGKTLDFNLDSIRRELMESGEQRGAFICEYAVFKEIYNLQMRNLERLGSTMFLAIIMVGNPNDPNVNSIKQNNVVNGLLEILRTNLRKGNTITHVSPTIIALLLPTVNYATGNLVMERIKRLFYRKYPNSTVAFNYRVGPLSSEEKYCKENVKEY